MARERIGNLPPSGLTLALAGLGAASLELAICGMTHAPPAAIARAGGLVAAMIVAFVVLGRRSRSGAIGRATLSPGEVLAMLALAAMPCAWHGARAALLGEGVMPETLLLEGLRNLGLGLGATARRPQAARLAAVVALFGVLVGSSLVEGAAMTAMAGAFAVLGACWMLAGYWSGLPEHRAGRAGPPIAGLVAALAVVGVILGIALIGPTTAATALASLVPTSGGHDWADPEARSGVGDGPNEVEARDSADSVGFSQSEVYLETDAPSLYDAYSEIFGEPIKKKPQEKAIALAPTEIQRSEEHPSEDHRAGREFSTHRKPPAGRRPPGQEADALLYVRGRAPAHLRLVAYDTFDGRSWIEGPPSGGSPTLCNEGPTSPWLRVVSGPVPYLSGRVRHRVKVGRLDTRAIPSPAHLDRFRVGSVNRIDFYEWSQPEVLRMSGRTIPPGTVIDTEARTPSPARLRRLAIPEAPSYALHRHRDDGAASPVVAELARRWAAGIPRGWGQVEAVVAHLRGHCAYDRSATPPEDCPDVMAHFLVEARRGPDYLFATAAALMLRSLGYPTRVVGGLYVDPRRFDPIARHTPVVAEDAHLWAEVQLPGGGWVAVEPTPGFATMPPALSPEEQLAAALAAVGRWAGRNALGLAGAAIAAALLYRGRRRALDLLWTIAWRLGLAASTPGRAVLGTLRLVERRASWAGRPRSPGQTPARWCGALGLGVPDGPRDDLRRLVRLAEWHAYARRPLPADTEIRALCRRVARAWTLGALRSLPADPARVTQEFAS